MSLYRSISGAGPDVALLHGWGLHGGVFASLATALASTHRVHVLDLPGHGYSPWSKSAGDLEGWARLTAAHLPARCAVIGWSLGGLVAHRVASLFPERVSHLILMGTAAVGTKCRDFTQAADPSLLAGLGARLQRDWRATILEFFNIAVRGDENPLDALRVLRQQIDSHGAPNRAALAVGLELLRTTDLRVSSTRVRMPTLLIGGEYDRLSPAQGVGALAERIAGAQLHIVPAAAHAPFLSQPAAVASLIQECLTA